jgi:methylenetetrahydrofolate reductase (NADPH)
LLERVFFLIGIAPLASAQSAHWIRKNLPGAIISDAIVARMERASDQKAEGRRICVELLRQLAEMNGVAGAHVMAPLNEASLAPTLAEFRGR